MWFERPNGTAHRRGHALERSGVLKWLARERQPDWWRAVAVVGVYTLLVEAQESASTAAPAARRSACGLTMP